MARLEYVCFTGDHLRGLQGVLPSFSEQRDQLPVPQAEELRRRPGEQEQMPVLSTTEMHGPRNVSRW